MNTGIGLAEVPTLQRQWRARVVNTLLITATIAAAPAMFMVLINAVRLPQRWPAALVYLLIYLVFVVLAVARWMDYRWRAWGLLVMGYVLSMLAMLWGGLAGDGRVYLLGLPILALILLGLRAGIAVAVLSIVSYAGFMVAAYLGWLAGVLVVTENSLNPGEWAQGGAAMGLTLIMVMVVQWLHTQFQTTMTTTNQQLYAEADRLRVFNESIVQSMDEGVLLRNLEDRITFVNQRLAALLDYAPEELLGRYWACVLAPEKLADLETRAVTGRCETVLQSRTGRQIAVIVSSRPLVLGEQFSGVVSVFTDITDRKRDEAQILRQIQHLSALRTIDAAITSSHDVRLALNVIFDQLMAQLRVDAADVLLYNAASNTLEYAAGRGFRTEALRHTLLHLGEGYAGRAAQERAIVSIANLADSGEDFLRSPLLRQEGFVTYYGVPLVAKGETKGVLEVFHRAPLLPDRDWLNFLEALAMQAAIAIDNTRLFTDLQRSNVELTLAYDATIEGWSRALELRDHETEGHTRRVTEMTVRLARAMGVSGTEIVHIRRGALLHDIGKVGIPDAILLKPGPLTNDERVLMCQHPVYAYEMLAAIEYLRPALDIPRYHHEKWDGTGYPNGLQGENIPLPARLFAVVDVWDALRSDRPYREAWAEAKVYDYIQSLREIHFDPQVADIFLQMVRDDMIT